MQETLAADPQHGSLYERLGGEAGIRQIVEDIVEAHMANPDIKARFLPYREDPEHLDEVKANLAAFFAAGAGGPDHYQGRSMAETHRGMNVGAAEYMAATDDILETLAARGHDEETRAEVLAILYSLKGEIIGH